MLTHAAVSTGGEEYVYQSCTQSADDDGAMDGSFWFVPGSLDAPTGPGFAARVRAFVFEASELSVLSLLQGSAAF